MRSSTAQELDSEIEAYYNQFDCHLKSIPGIGKIIDTIILSEIGDITRFKSAKALVAYAGIDPTVKQSGQFLATPITKCLNVFLLISEDL